VKAQAQTWRVSKKNGESSIDGDKELEYDDDKDEFDSNVSCQTSDTVKMEDKNERYGGGDLRSEEKLLVALGSKACGEAELVPSTGQVCFIASSTTSNINIDLVV